MKLKTTLTNANNSVIGIQAVVIKDDVNGASLVIQQDKQQLVIKLSDIIDFIQEQNKPISNPEAEGSKGDSEAE